jgi:ubiquinone/menaquinone biosynthesis C-methylase UbiE
MNEWDKKRDIMRRYDVTADIYDLRYEQEQTAKYVAAFESLENRRLGLVIDVGCGTGLLFGRLKERAETIVGLDISRKTLVKAKERARSSADMHLVLADADSMPLKAGTFDHAFAMTIIQNSPVPVQTLNEIERVSKDDALIVVTGLKKIFSRKDFVNLLRKAGLRIVTLNDEEGLKCYVAICTRVYH